MSGICGFCILEEGSQSLALHRMVCGMGEALGGEEEVRTLWQGENCLLAGRRRPEVSWEEDPLALGRPGTEQALAYWDGRELLCARDRLGEMSLFYLRRGNSLAFATSPAPLFPLTGSSPALSREGLCQLLGAGPARAPGLELYQGFRELPPACRLTLGPSGLQCAPYWRLEARTHREGPDDTARRLRALAAREVHRRARGDGMPAVLLSGGPASSLVAALAARDRTGRGEPPLETLSLHPPQGKEETPPRARTVAGVLHTSHRELEWNAPALAAALEEAGTLEGQPGLGGLDAAWLYLCRQISPHRDRLLSGGWARVILEDLPWSRGEDRSPPPALPWCPDLGVRRRLFRREVWEELAVEEVLAGACARSLARCPRLEGEPPWERRRREAGWLTLEWWLALALAAEGRAARAAGVSLRRPLCTPELMEYAWNIPHGMKTLNGQGRALLREAATPLLPPLPAPSPRSGDRGRDGSLYAHLVGARLAALLDDPSAPLLELADPAVLRRELLEEEGEGWGWPGPGSGRVQLMGWLIQLNALLRLSPPR